MNGDVSFSCFGIDFSVCDSAMSEMAAAESREKREKAVGHCRVKRLIFFSFSLGLFQLALPIYPTGHSGTETHTETQQLNNITNLNTQKKRIITQTHEFDFVSLILFGFAHGDSRSL